jgi:hypothetical protein
MAERRPYCYREVQLQDGILMYLPVYLDDFIKSIEVKKVVLRKRYKQPRESGMRGSVYKKRG